MSAGWLAFDGVTFGYQRGTPVLDQLDLALVQGRITCLLGPNGCGKTTLLHLALGWLKPWCGEVRLQGKRLQHYNRQYLGTQIALIPQSEHVPYDYSVLEYVLLGRTPHLKRLEMPAGEDVHLAYQALEQVGMADLYHKSILEISGGEKQLVLAARALAQQPSLLLLDEPTSHLDVGNKRRLLHILHDLAPRGTTVLMTTHEPEVALAVSDEVVLLKQGKILSAGSTPECVTSANLSLLYGVPISVVSVEGRQHVLWM